MRLLSVALHEEAESPAFPRGSGLQRAPRRAGWSFGRRCEGDGEKCREEKAGPENGGKLPLAIGQGSDRHTKNHVYNDANAVRKLATTVGSRLKGKNYEGEADYSILGWRNFTFFKRLVRVLF